MSNAVVEYTEHAVGVTSSPFKVSDCEVPCAADPIDDSKTPPVFGSLWREFVSVFTLAFPPALNVSVFY